MTSVIHAGEVFGADRDDGRRLERLPGGGYALVLDSAAVRIELRHLRRDARQLHAEVDVQANWAGAPHHKGSLSCADLNLSSQSARKSLAKYCAERSRSKPAEFDWMGAIDAACIEAIAAERAGAAAIVLDDAADQAERDVDILGLHVPIDAASMLIAHGDSLKSLVLLLVLGVMAERGQRVLYLDYEWTAARHKARKRRLFGTDRIENLRYLRCRAPLPVEVDAIRRYCEQERVTFIGLDSVGLACDGKLADDDTAIRFHRALGSLPPSLCAAHVPKSTLGPDAKDAIGPFGSVFFSNLCRMSWLVKKQPGASDDVVSVGLFPQKQNDGTRHRPVGLEFAFEDNHIAVRPVDLATVDGLAEKLSLTARMAHILKRGPMTLAAIAAELEHDNVDSIDRLVRRHKATFTKVPSADGITRIALVERRAS